LVRMYKKGAQAERELIKLLKGKGFDPTRAAGSKGLMDIVALHEGKAYVFQVKYTKYDTIRIRRKEICKLVDLYYRHNPNPDKETTAVYLAVKFRRHGWRFYPVIKLWSLLSGVFDTFELKPKDGLPLDGLLNWLNHQISS